MDVTDTFPPNPESYRSYLRTIAESRLMQRVIAKLDASDIVQETMLQACSAATQFRGKTEDEYRAWLVEIMRNVCHGVHRHFGAAKRNVKLERSLQQALHESAGCLERFLQAAQTSPSQIAMRAEAINQLLSKVDQLPEDQQTAVRLHHLEGMNLANVALEMGRTKDSVAGLLRRASQTLRVHMR